MMKILITGANRGIGLELTRQLKTGGHEVFAACRQSSAELHETGAHIREGIDVARDDAIERLHQALGGVTLDLIINCAGVLEGVSLDNLDFDSIVKQFQINAVGPLRVIKGIERCIVDGGKVAMITSRMGSIADNTSGGSYGYRMSKAALNIASVSLAHDLAPRNIAVAIIHPGYVQTEMTGFRGNLTPEESARGIIERIEELNMSNSGTFWHQSGEVLPW
ncbi:MAG: SDR family oxidoreductase [Candidatus Omnitrophica bacterium]|nr:SDR family oxidoreductase [Candidatus Omnitrophota bacterium]